MREPARKAVGRITVRTLDETYRYGDERADMLDAIAEALRSKAHELRAAKVDSPEDGDERDAHSA